MHAHTVEVTFYPFQLVKSKIISQRYCAVCSNVSQTFLPFSKQKEGKMLVPQFIVIAIYADMKIKCVCCFKF